MQFILEPKISFNESNSLRNAGAEFSSARTAVVSSAYCGNLVSFLPMEIPLILEFCLIETADREFKTTAPTTAPTTVKHATAHDQNHVTVHFSCVVLPLR